MNNRRNFLIKGSLATSAMLALKPLESFARATSSITGISARGGKMFFLHTTDLDPHIDHKVIGQIKEVQKRHVNTILLQARHDKTDKAGSLSYDACFQDQNSFEAFAGDCKIIYKGDIKTGIIYAKPGEENVIEKINNLSTYLKKEKNCTLVVCLSGLGFKNKHTPGDLDLASQSTDLDIIISGHPENFKAQPFIALNRDNSEVIIHAASRKNYICRGIEIDIDAHGLKKQVGFSNHS